MNKDVLIAIKVSLIALLAAGLTAYSLEVKRRALLDANLKKEIANPLGAYGGD